MRHLVIFIYIAELIAFTMLAAGRHRSGVRLSEQPVVMLCAFMVLRLIVKLVYFYVEFYVLPWHLDIFYNMVMDSTYVVSVTLCLLVICSNAKIEIPRKKLYAFAAICYVASFVIVSFLWVDRASNHLIILENDFARAAYIINELLFISVALSTVISMERSARGSDAAALARALCIAAGIYAIYVFFWDVSFVFPSIEPLRLIKPFDGVLVFGAALILIIIRLCPADAAPVQEKEAEQSAAVDLDAFAAEHGLTAREAEVLELLFQGKSTSQVAEDLVISVNTAKRHAYNIYRKVGVGSRYELIYRINHPNEAIPASISADSGE
ncbi:MAG: helix-turn-helix transcriptional regulator [Atopobiaceae bacterium]|nr:helix-turn-helix transcriptional regulator [Atopobiaceae bacterium]